MGNFTEIGQMVTEARNLLDSIKGGAIRTMETSWQALISTVNTEWSNKKASVDSEWQTKKTRADSDISAAIARVDDYSDSFHRVGNFYHKTKNTPWTGDATHYNYLLIHVEPDASEDLEGGSDRKPFFQVGRILMVRNHATASMKYAVIDFVSARGYGGVSELTLETKSLGLAAPVVVRNFPHNGKLYRAIRFSPASTMYSGLNISVDYKESLNDNRVDESWLDMVAIEKTAPQLGEVI